jgi:hypothetical protein
VWWKRSWEITTSLDNKVCILLNTICCLAMWFLCFTGYLPLEILVSEETTNGADKIVEPSNSSPGPNGTNGETSTDSGTNFTQKFSTMNHH